jgi:prevent-host-death family protein
MQLGLREANQHFSRAIRAVRAGREVVLTDRGRPIAIITPVKNNNAREATLRALADEGVITLAPRKGAMPPPRGRPVKVKGTPLSETIIEDRRDRF